MLSSDLSFKKRCGKRLIPWSWKRALPSLLFWGRSPVLLDWHCHIFWVTSKVLLLKVYSCGKTAADSVCWTIVMWLSGTKSCREKLVGSTFPHPSSSVLLNYVALCLWTESAIWWTTIWITSKGHWAWSNLHGCAWTFVLWDSLCSCSTTFLFASAQVSKATVPFWQGQYPNLLPGC